MENGRAGQGSKPKSPVSKPFDASGEEDNIKEFAANNWYGKLKGMSNSLKKLTQSRKRFPPESGQGLGRVLSFNSSKSVDHGSSSSKKDLAATNLKGLGYNSVDLSCGISRGLNITPTGVLPKRRNKSLELPRDVSKDDVTPFFSKSKIPIVKSNFAKEGKEESDDSRGGGHQYQRLALGSDSEDEPTAEEHPASTSLEYESSLANLMLMEKLGSRLGSQSPIVDEVSKQDDAGDVNGTLPTNSVPAKSEAPTKRLDVIISRPASAGAKEGVGGAGQKSSVRSSSSGGTTAAGWPLRRVAGVGSGPLHSNGRSKVDKKINTVAVETANTGMKGKGAPFGRKNIKSMSGELFILKSSKKSGVDPVVPARKSVSDIPSRKSVSKDAPAKKQHLEFMRPLSSKIPLTGTFSDVAPRKSAARVISKKPSGDTPLARKSVDPGKEFEGQKFQLGGAQYLSSELVLSDSQELSPASVPARDSSINTVGFPKAIPRSGPADEGIHGQSQDDIRASSTQSSRAAGCSNEEDVDGGVNGKEEGVLMAGSESMVDEGTSPISGYGIADASSNGSLIERPNSSDTRKSVQDLIRELERNAGPQRGSGKSQQPGVVTPHSKEKITGETVAERSADDVRTKTSEETASECKSSNGGHQMEVTNDIPTSTSSTGREGVDLNNVSLSMFNSASVTTELQNDALRAELSESFEELHHKLKIDLDPRVVQDIHRTFNIGLVQAVAAASVSESVASRLKPNAEVESAAGPDPFRANQFMGDGNRRKKLVAPPRTLGAAAYTNTIIEGLGGPAGTTTKPSAIRDIVPAGFVMDAQGDDLISTEDNSREPPLDADIDSCESDQARPDEDLPGEIQEISSSVESSEVRILSSTSSNKMLTSENFHRVAARLAGHNKGALLHAKLPHREVPPQVAEMPRSSIDSVDVRSSPSSNKMLSSKNVHRVAALLNEYSADMKSGLVSQPRPAGGLDSSSSSFNRLEPMLNDFETAESTSEADRTTITKEVVAFSGMSPPGHPGTISSLSAVNTPPSSKSNESSSARSRGRRSIASRYRNVDYSPKVQSKLGHSFQQRDQGSGSNLSSARRSLDLQFKSQISDPYYRKPKQSKSGAPHSSMSASAQVDRNHPKKGSSRARSPSAKSISRGSTQGRRAGQARGSDPDPIPNHESDTDGDPAVASILSSDVRSRTVPHEQMTSQQPMFRQKHHLSQPEYIDEANDNSSVWLDNGRMQDEPEASTFGLSNAATRLKNSGLRPHDNLSYNGDVRSTRARPNFSGPLIYTKLQDGGLPSEGEESEEGQWPKSGPIIPASVLREIYDDRDISDDQDLVVDRTTFSAGVVRGARDTPSNHNRSGSLYFSGPLVSQTIRNSRLLHSGPPSSFSEQFFDRVSEPGKYSRSASARIRETEGMDTVEDGDGVAPDKDLHESYDEHQHEYLIQDHDQLYEYLDQYSDHHTFLDQYIADQLHELSLQQDLHEILSDQLEKVQAAKAAGSSDVSSNSGGDIEMVFEEALPRGDQTYETAGDGDVVRANYHSDAQEETDREDEGMNSECSSEQPHEKVLHSQGMDTKSVVSNSLDNQDHLAMGDTESGQEPAPPGESICHDDASAAKEHPEGSDPFRDLNVASAEAAAPWYKRSSSSKSLAASLPDVHQDSLLRSTVSSRAKSKQYNSEDAVARLGGGYESDRIGGDPSGTQRLQANRDFMNTSIQSEPGDFRGLLSKSRGTNSAYSSPARRPSSSRDRAGNFHGDPWDSRRQPDGQYSSKSSPNPSALVAPDKSSVESPALGTSRTSFPSLYLMQVSSSTYQPAPSGTRPSKKGHLQPPSRNLLTQNISTISIEDFTSGRRPNLSAKTGPSNGAATRWAKNASQMKGLPVGSQMSSPVHQNQQKPENNTPLDLLNTSIQSEPGSHARSLLLSLEYQNKLSRGLSTSLNPEQMTRGDHSPQSLEVSHPQPSLLSPLPPSTSPIPAIGDLDVNRSRRTEQPQEVQASTDTTDDEDSLLDDSSNVGIESGGETSIQAPNDPESYEHTTDAPLPFPGTDSSYDRRLPAMEADEGDEDADSLEAITVVSTMSVGAFRREALRKFGAQKTKDVDESSQEQHSNFDARSTRLLSERSYYMSSKAGGGATAMGPGPASPAGQLPNDLQDTVAKKRSELEKLCEAVDPCLDFHYAIVDMILDKDDINDLVDLEEFLNCYLSLRQPYQDVVKHFFGELCEATFVY